MARKPPPDRFSEIVRTAGNIFRSKGYRRTQMADITSALGLSPGAIYRYVESKEALFDLVVRTHTSAEVSLDALELPIPTPAAGATLAFLADTLSREAGALVLARAVATEHPADIRAELDAVVRELYHAVARHQRGLKLLERSALDWPELAELWWGRARQAVVDLLTAYLGKRMEAGYLRRSPDPAASARLFTETTAYFAMHRHDDPQPTTMSDETAEETAVDALVHVYLKE